MQIPGFSIASSDTSGKSVMDVSDITPETADSIPNAEVASKISASISLSNDQEPPKKKVKATAPTKSGNKKRRK